MNNKHVETDKLTLVTNSGKKLLVSVVVSPVGQLGQGVIAVFRDITAKKRQENEQSEFVSTASHEMRTPVAAIEGYLGLALNPNTAQIDEKARDFLEKAHANAQHLGRLFQDLLDITKADDGRLSNNPQLIEVIPFIGGVVEDMTAQATEKQLAMKYLPAGRSEDRGTVFAGPNLAPVFYMHVDADHLREVTLNLIENAIKYTPAGTVTVSVEGNANRVKISITDTGIGIPKEDQAHLFQKFYRIDNTDTREIGGTGLGLYLCRKLTEQMGGKIWVESERGKGSTFSIEFPRLDKDEVERIRRDEEAAAAASQQTVVESTPEPTPTPAAATSSQPPADRSAPVIPQR